MLPRSSLRFASSSLDAQIYGPAGEGHYSVQRQRQGHFTVIAPKTGMYKLCFGNRLSTSTEKVGHALVADARAPRGEWGAKGLVAPHPVRPRAALADDRVLGARGRRPV